MKYCGYVISVNGQASQGCWKIPEGSTLVLRTSVAPLEGASIGCGKHHGVCADLNTTNVTYNSLRAE